MSEGDIAAGGSAAAITNLSTTTTTTTSDGPSTQDLIAALLKNKNGSEVHIGQRIYVQDGPGGGSGKSNDIVLESDAAHRTSGQAVAVSSIAGASEVAASWSKRDYVSIVVFMSVVVILLILIFLVIRPRSREASSSKE